MSEPENLVLQLLREMRGKLDAVADSMATKADVADLRAQMATKADLATLRADVSDQIVGLRRAVIDYHTAVIGHGVIISDLEGRLRRVEQHLNLPPLGAH